MMSMLKFALSIPFYMSRRDCDSIQILQSMSHGIVKEALLGTYHNETIVVKKVYKYAVDKRKGKPFLPLNKLFYEATLLHDLQTQYPEHAAKFYGMCSNKFHVMEKLSKIHMRDPQIAQKFIDCIYRMSHFHAAPLAITDVKLEQFGQSKNGDIHLLDLGDVIMSSNTPMFAFNQTWRRVQKKIFRSKRIHSSDK